MFAAFPEWYATLFSGFYLPLLLILVALIVRGVAFEYREQARRRRPGSERWDTAIIFGSFVPALLWGVAFGEHRPRRADRRRRTSTSAAFFDLLNPYALLGGAGHADGVPGARRVLRGAQDRRRHPRAGPRGLAQVGSGRRRPRGRVPRLDRAATHDDRLGHRCCPALPRSRSSVGSPPAWAVATAGPSSARRSRSAGVVIDAVRGAVPRRHALDARPGVQPDHRERVVDAVHAEDHDAGSPWSSRRSSAATRPGRTGCSASASACSTSRRDVPVEHRRLSVGGPPGSTRPLDPTWSCSRAPAACLATASLRPSSPCSWSLADVVARRFDGGTRCWLVPAAWPRCGSCAAACARRSRGPTAWSARAPPSGSRPSCAHEVVDDLLDPRRRGPRPESGRRRDAARPGPGRVRRVRRPLPARSWRWPRIVPAVVVVAVIAWPTRCRRSSIVVTLPLIVLFMVLVGCVTRDRVGAALARDGAAGAPLHRRARRPRGAQGVRAPPGARASARSATATGARRCARCGWRSCRRSCSS